MVVGIDGVQNGFELLDDVIFYNNFELFWLQKGLPFLEKGLALEHLIKLYFRYLFGGKMYRKVVSALGLDFLEVNFLEELLKYRVWGTQEGILFEEGSVSVLKTLFEADSFRHLF